MSRPNPTNASIPDQQGGRRAMVSANWTVTRITPNNTQAIDFEDSEEPLSGDEGRITVTDLRTGIPVVQRRNVLRPATARMIRPNEEVFSSFMLPFIQQPTASASQPTHYTLNPSLRNKPVHVLDCRFCEREVCVRAMKAILLADTKVELYSTDIPPNHLRLLEEDRITTGCNCRIRDTACDCCGNVLGYHVSQPCERCLEAKNNGHFWMFYSETISARERADPTGLGKPLTWGLLPTTLEHILLSDFACALVEMER